MKTFTLGILLLAASPACAENVEVKFRLTGLFQPDRVEDLRRQAGELRANRESPVDVRLVKVDYETATVTFRYDNDSQSFKNRNPEQVRDQINNLLQHVSRGSFNLFPLSELKPDDLREEQIAVAGLDCKGCAYGAYRAIAMIDGVERGVVSFKDGFVKAWINPQKTNRGKLIEALKMAQVDVTETPAK